MYLEGYDGNPSDYHHKDYSECDSCGKSAHGTMLYAQGATGRICAVLFLCKDCDSVSYADAPTTPPIIKDKEKRYGTSIDPIAP